MPWDKSEVFSFVDSKKSFAFVTFILLGIAFHDWLLRAMRWFSLNPPFAPHDWELRFVQGVLQSIFASLWFSWSIYLLRHEIRGYFLPRRLTVKSPIATAMAPLLYARHGRVWDRHGLNVMVDLGATGLTSLDAMSRGECDIAVAADYAVCSFLNGHTSPDSERFCVLPFTHLSGGLKIASRNNNLTNTSQLIGMKLAFWQGSIHMELLGDLKLAGMTSSARSDSLFDFLDSSIDACLLSEPYFLTFEKAGYNLISPGQQYGWYMCLVVKEQLLQDHGSRVLRHFLEALGKACRETEEKWPIAAAICAEYVLRDFTGIDVNQLVALKDDLRIQFGVPLKKEFTERVKKLQNNAEVSKGAVVLGTSLWPKWPGMG